MSTKPQFYIAYLSGPCRSIILALKKLGKLDQVDLVEVDLAKGENRTPEFLAMNPFHTVPTLKHGDLCLYESTAIIEYLNEILKLDGEWGFTNDNVVQKYKEINMLHKWHNFAVAGQRPIVTPFYATLLAGVPLDVDAMKAGLEKTKADQYKMLDELLAKNGGFVTGNKPTIVDVHYWIDIFQMTPDGKYTLHIYDFEQHPNVKAWLQKVKEAVFDEEIYNGPLYEFVKYAEATLEGKYKLLNQ